MKIVIIGAGASGIAASINLKRKHPNDDVLVIEQLDKPLKKILATGNGKCNLGNSNINFSLYNNPDIAKEIISNYKYEEFFDSISIKTKLIGELAYPVSESAVSVREALLNETKKLGIKIQTDEKLIDYEPGEKVTITTNKGVYMADMLVLASGLKSSPKLGSDGSIIEILRKHNYEIETLEPGLSPIFTKEKTRLIDGVRCKANVRLIKDNKIIHEESGEVLFKEHGLSGIVIFNTASIISRYHNSNFMISLDLLPDYSASYLNNYLSSRSINDLLLAFINPKLSNYLKDRFNNDSMIVRSLKNLEFTFEKSYGFDFSQVTVGGIKVTEVKENLESKREKNIFIIGEVLDIDGPCGGYNLTWAFASAFAL